MSETIKNEVLALKDEMIDIRRDFHKYPELGMEEKRTPQVVADLLGTYGLHVKTEVGKTGVVGLLEGSGPGKTVMLRADMDALPIQEGNDKPFHSLTGGLMHACGHDGHMAILLGAAKILSKHRDDFKGAVKFVFQPGEEGFAGARYMIDDGVMENPKVDAAFALHLGAYLPVGSVSARPGATMASMDSFSLKIKGKGGHAAMPQEGADALLMSAHVVSALQSLISKEVSPTSPFILHMGTIHGGNAFNIIAESVQIEGTVRTHDETLRNSIPERMNRLCNGITSGLGGSHELDYRFGYPTLVNDGDMTAFFREVAKGILTEEKVGANPPIMASDDMAFFLEKAPGCYFNLGAANPEKGPYGPAHSSSFDFDEDALVVGAEIMAELALKYLKSP